MLIIDNAFHAVLLGNHPSWYCEVVILKTAEDNKLHFPVLRWVEPGYRYKIPVNDTSLPQDDPFPDQRQKELEISREKYQIKVVSPDLPIQVRNMNLNS